jgi:L-iditol 2-dehydrogenase
LKPGHSVLVLGSGISGLLHVSVARALGAGSVLAADTIPFRLKKAEEMGAHACLNADESLVESLREFNEGRLADFVIICFEGFIPLAFQSVEKGGTILFFSGASEGATIPAPINDVFWRTEITLTSTYAGAPYDCETALKLIHGGTVPVTKTITHRLALEEGPDGFQKVCTPSEHECIKVIVEPEK